MQQTHEELSETCLLPDILNRALGGSRHLPAILPCLCRHLKSTSDEVEASGRVKQCSCSSGPAGE